MSTPRLTIRLKKNADDSAALSCTRADGTVTWQRQQGAQGQFFPRHDLTHYAVESVLGFTDAFYGLIAGGWDISHFAPPWPSGRLTPQAAAAELIVGFLDAERAAGVQWAAVDFNDKAALHYAARGVDAAPPTITDDELARIRQRRAELFERWGAVPAGSTLELTFPARSGADQDGRKR
jgi:hypothetical protein